MHLRQVLVRTEPEILTGLSDLSTNAEPLAVRATSALDEVAGLRARLEVSEPPSDRIATELDLDGLLHAELLADPTVLLGPDWSLLFGQCTASAIST